MSPRLNTQHTTAPQVVLKLWYADATVESCCVRRRRCSRYSLAPSESYKGLDGRTWKQPLTSSLGDAAEPYPKVQIIVCKTEQGFLAGVVVVLNQYSGGGLAIASLWWGSDDIAGWWTWQAQEDNPLKVIYGALFFELFEPWWICSSGSYDLSKMKEETYKVVDVPYDEGIRGNLGKNGLNNIAIIADKINRRKNFPMEFSEEEHNEWKQTLDEETKKELKETIQYWEEQEKNYKWNTIPRIRAK
ncbi:MAG: hypothetical protein Ta2E_09120 [Mycoplasmoidaceae bacterium]|nr:MAG: hypothetical protein Ta2E_09120 [Mycoplasmoidaceae bacterium]